MHLKLDSLQKLVKNTLNEERLAGELKAEIKRVLGPVIVTEGRINEVVAAANDRLDVLDRTGRAGGLSTWEPKVTARWLDHTDPEVRKFAARVVPERYLGRVSDDRSPTVRAAVAARVPLSVVREMMKRFPRDDQLRAIFRHRKLHEAGITQPKAQPMGHDPADGKERMGDAARTGQGPELSEAWYHQQAMKFMHDFGQNIEYAWEEVAAHRFCASMKATSGVEVDEAKLLKSIKELIKEKEDMALERDALSETLDWLERQEEQEVLAEGALPEFKESIDPVNDLVHAGLTREQYLAKAAQVFSVQNSMLPLGIRKYRLGEGNARQTFVPCIGKLPHSGGFRAVDERALDTFCEGWTKRQQQVGEPLVLGWSVHPTDVSKVSFSCTLR